MMQKLSPVLLVDAIEPALPFYVDRLGFEVTAKVPLAAAPDALGFAILDRDGVEVMLQTRRSVQDDLPQLANEPNRAFLFVEVEDVDAIARALQGCEIVVPRRRTFYGADEIGVRAPGGHVLVFAQVAAAHDTTEPVPSVPPPR